MCSAAGSASVLVTVAITVEIAPVKTKVTAIMVEVATIMDKVTAVIYPVIPDIGPIVTKIRAIVADVHPVLTNVAVIIGTALGLSAYGEEKAGGDEYGQFEVHTSKF